MEEEQYIEQTYWRIRPIKNTGVAEKLADLFASRDDEFAATVLYGGRLTRKTNERYDKTKRGKFVECVNASGVYYVVLTNSDRIKRDMIFGLRINMMKAFNVVSFGVTHSYFDSDEKLRKFLDIGTKIVDAVDPAYGLVHDRTDFLTITGDEPVRILERIPGVFWGNYFGEPYISKIGRERLLSATAYKVEELNHGGIYIQLSDMPFKSSSREERRAQNNLAKHLGIR